MLTLNPDVADFVSPQEPSELTPSNWNGEYKKKE